MDSLENLQPAATSKEADLNLKLSNLKEFLSFLQQELNKPELPETWRQQLEFIALATLLMLGSCAPEQPDDPTAIATNSAVPGTETVGDAGAETAPGGEITGELEAGTTITIQPGQTLYEISKQLINGNLAPVPTPQFNPDTRTHYEEYARQILTHLLIDYIVQTNGNIANPLRLPVGQTIQLPSQATINQLHSQAQQQADFNFES